MAGMRLPDKVSDSQALALALERLRRASEKVLDTIAIGENMDTALSELEAAHASSAQDTHSYLLWAQDVLDGAIAHGKKRRGGRKPASFDVVRKEALRNNIIVHFVHTLEGTEYAIYRGQYKAAHAKSVQRCISVMRAMMRTK